MNNSIGGGGPKGMVLKISVRLKLYENLYPVCTIQRLNHPYSFMSITLNIHIEM